MKSRRGLARPVAELALWLALAVVAFALTFEFADEAGTYDWGAASWPRAVILFMAVAVIAQFAIRLHRPALHAAEAGTGGVRAPTAKTAKLAAALGLPLLYVFLLPRSGFYVTTPVFLFAYLVLLGERRPAALIGAPLVIYAAINLVFTKLFYVALPTGNWPGFYDISNWFLVTVR